MTDLIASIERAMAVTRDLPPPVWRYYVSAEVLTIKRQWRSDGRLIVWLPRAFYDSLPRTQYGGHGGFEVAGIVGAGFGTPVEVLDR